MKFNKIGKDSWESEEDQVFTYGKGSISIDIEKGFKTDLASFPFPIYHLLNKEDPKYALPCAVHDKLYTIKQFSKLMSDAILYQALKEAGVNAKIRLTFFIVVSLFGWKRWLS